MQQRIHIVHVLVKNKGWVYSRGGESKGAGTLSPERDFLSVPEAESVSFLCPLPASPSRVLFLREGAPAAALPWESPGAPGSGWPEQEASPWVPRAAQLALEEQTYVQILILSMVTLQVSH